MADVSIGFATQDAEVVVNLSAVQALRLAEAITRNIADAVSGPGQNGAESPWPDARPSGQTLAASQY
ncbi:hypothetical protein [Frankia sp. EAN1pec]|uniref:hypothetical protein n=1 Tax=Parafrankia sp. (strain EAN1pec) TaxID=298653 RepID=UPI0012FA4072